MSPISAEMKGSALNEVPPANDGTSSPPTPTTTKEQQVVTSESSTEIVTPVTPPETEMQLPTSSTPCEPTLIPKYGTLIPNRVFVGGISTHTTESELATLFSKYGSVRGTKIILDRVGISKGYGFVTYETEDEARRLFTAMNNRELPPIVHRDRRLNIAPAVKKQPVITRQGCSYYGTSPSGSASTTLSPPPTLVESPFYFPTGGTTPSGTDFLFQGASHHHPALPDASSFIYPGAHNPFPFFAAGGAGGTQTTPNGLGLGQALPGPNGSIIFLPFGLNPYQQQPQSIQGDPWNSTSVTSALPTFALPHSSPSLPHWARLHHQASTMGPPQLPPVHPTNTNHHHYSTQQHATASSHHHHHHNQPHHHPYLSEQSATPQHPDPLLYFSNALISTPH